MLICSTSEDTEFINLKDFKSVLKVDSSNKIINFDKYLILISKLKCLVFEGTDLKIEFYIKIENLLNEDVFNQIMEEKLKIKINFMYKIKYEENSSLFIMNNQQICRIKGYIHDVLIFNYIIFLLTFDSLYQLNLDNLKLKKIFIGKVCYKIGSIFDDLILIHNDIEYLKNSFPQSIKENKFKEK